MASVIIKEAWGRVNITLGAAATKGQLIGASGALAKAATTPVYAHYLCGQDGASGETVTCWCGGVVSCADYDLTADDMVWLSDTAGAVVKAAPSTSTSLNQIVGIAHSATEYVFSQAGAFTTTYPKLHG